MPLYPRFTSLLHFPPQELAAQLTLIDSELFRAIRLEEIVNQAWNNQPPNSTNDTKDNLSSKCVRTPNLLRFIHHGNNVANWVANCVVLDVDVKNRRRTYQNFVILCSYLKAMCSFNMLMGILSGLNSAAVQRLRLTRSELPTRINKTKCELDDLMSSTSSFKIYRSELEKCSPPIVPFMGVTLTDLTFIEEGNKKYLGQEGLFNLKKYHLFSSIFQTFVEYQRLCNYMDLKETKMKMGFLRRVQQYLIPPGDLYDISLLREPRRPS
eukprot:Lithocolla_globosa_v1_NODE_1237_length_2749_cov_8.935412.p1 type:complete len:267 gc:universal NODE_1237_length_2749_cov_8.935412:1858-2658(+)